MFNNILTRYLQAGSRITRSLLIAILGAGLLVPTAVSASGGGGFEGAGGGGVTPRAPRKVDQLYEYGKAIYTGRAPGVQKIGYCLKVDGETKKLRGRHLKAWRGRPKVDFANALYNCENPKELALLNVQKEEVAYVLYYLDKRFKLNLDSARS